MRNTVMLYFRMILTMLVGLYSSRVVINVLGFSDYGIYNVVGGIIVMFSFFNAAMSAATQRFITFEIGEGNSEKLKKIFSHAVVIHALIGLLVLVLAETIGLWFLYNKLEIPPERLTAAFWVYQFSIFSSVILISSVPYYAFIIAYEHMHFYAIVSIIDSLLKLGIVFLLQFVFYDKLILWAGLTFITSFISRILYRAYAKRKFSSCKFNFKLDKKVFKEMTNMASWSLFGYITDAGRGQGVNILLNIFFGVVVNAARGIAFQVDGVIRGFVNNFQMALNPQITKSYASNNLDYMHKLIQQGGKLSYYLLLIITLPLLLETRIVLTWWLKDVPELTILFCRLVLINSLIESISGPLITAIFATGKIRKYQIIISFQNLLNLPLSYFALKLGYEAYYPFIISIFLSIMVLFSRLSIVSKQIDLSFWEYFKNVVLRILLVTMIVPIIPMLINNEARNVVFNFVVIVFSSVITTIAGVFYLGINKEDRLLVKEKVLRIVKNRQLKF